MSRHVLSLLVEDKPGLLSRVAGLFSRRGFNIDSLAVGPTEVEGLSRITVVVDPSASASPVAVAKSAFDRLDQAIDDLQRKIAAGSLP